MNARELILSRLGVGEAPLDRAPAVGPRELGRLSDDELWALFAQRLEALGGGVAGGEVLEGLAGQAVCFDADAGEWLPLDARSADPWEAEIGVTVADWAIAETASLLLSAGPGRQRLTSLTPPHHVALVRPGTMLATLDEAFARLDARTSVLVTGPSRTADIEGVLILGVHGPGSLTVVRL